MQSRMDPRLAALVLRCVRGTRRKMVRRHGPHLIPLWSSSGFSTDCRFPYFFSRSLNVSTANASHVVRIPGGGRLRVWHSGNPLARHRALGMRRMRAEALAYSDGADTFRFVLDGPGRKGPQPCPRPAVIPMTGRTLTPSARSRPRPRAEERKKHAGVESRGCPESKRQGWRAAKCLK